MISYEVSIGFVIGVLVVSNGGVVSLNETNEVCQEDVWCMWGNIGVSLILLI